jgi:hypothetical protein
MVTVKKLVLKNKYRIVWLRYISGVDLTQHCMKGLLGRNDINFRGYMRQAENIQLQKAKYYYLCGVDENWTYNNNMHVAFVEKEGSEIKIDNHLFSVHIENARQVKISPDYIDWSLKVSSNKLYNTCRNWWFANIIFKCDEDIRRNSITENDENKLQLFSE